MVQWFIHVTDYLLLNSQNSFNKKITEIYIIIVLIISSYFQKTQPMRNTRWRPFWNKSLMWLRYSGGTLKHVIVEQNLFASNSERPLLSVGFYIIKIMKLIYTCLLPIANKHDSLLYPFLLKLRRYFIIVLTWLSLYSLLLKLKKSFQVFASNTDRIWFCTRHRKEKKMSLLSGVTKNNWIQECLKI